MTPTTPTTSSSAPFSSSTRGITGGDGIYTPEVNARILDSLGPPPEILFLNACAENDVDEVDRLLKTTSVSVDCEDENGDTGLLLASRAGHVEVVQRILKTRGKKGIDVNRAPRGWTPLLVAVSRGHTEVAKILLEDKRTDTKLTTPLGDSVLHVACRLTPCPPDLLKMLLESGDLDPDARNATEWTPFLLTVARNPDLVPVFLANSQPNTALRTRQGNTALHLAAIHDRTGAALRALFADKRTDIEATVVGGWTAWHLACAKGNMATVRCFLEPKKVDCLAETDIGATGYVLAAQAGQREVVRFLQQNGLAVEGSGKQKIPAVSKLQTMTMDSAAMDSGFAVPETPVKRKRADELPNGSPASLWSIETADGRSPSPKRRRDL
jgi:ankyrin repeat protein